MRATVVYTRAKCALIIGARGANVLNVVSALERRGIDVIRADDCRRGWESITKMMPQLVVVFVPPQPDPDRDGLNDRAAAVGARVLDVDPELQAGALEPLLIDAIRAAFGEDVEPLPPSGRVTVPPNVSSTPSPGSTATVPPNDVDGGWDA